MTQVQVTTQTSLPKLVPLSKFNDFIPYPSVGSLRQSHFYNTDGFADKVIKKVCKRLYVDTDAFYKWIDECNQK